MAKGKPDTAHVTREQEMRANEEVHEDEDEPWVRPSSLEAPPSRPGMRQRWIRIGTLGKDDPVNSMRRFREGWKARPADTIPKKYNFPKIASGNHAGCIGVEGLLLCEMPESRALKRDAYFRDKNNMRTEAVNRQLVGANVNNPAYGPAHIDKNETFSKRVRAKPNVEVAPDEG